MAITQWEIIQVKKLSILFLVTVLFSVMGCSDKSETTTQANQAPQQAAPTAGPASYQGKVLEATQAGMYTYIKVDTDGKELWMAASAVKTNVGDTVSWTGGAMMQNFTSKAMKKTFDQILFVDKVAVVK